jgi:hypothetical protein
MLKVLSAQLWSDLVSAVCGEAMMPIGVCYRG